MFVVGHVGRFEYPKNHFFIVNVFEKIVEQHKDSILLLIGDGSMKTEIKELVLEKGLEIDEEVYFDLRSFFGVKDIATRGIRPFSF